VRAPSAKKTATAEMNSRLRRTERWSAAYRARLARFGPRDRAVRQAATLFIIIGLLGLTNDALPGAVGYSKLTSAMFDAANLAAGIIAMLLPWRRWSPRASLVLALVAMGNIVGASIAGVIPEATIGFALVLTFVWVGSWHPPRTAFVLAPLILVANLVPFAVGPSQPNGAMAALILNIAVAIVVSETLARNAAATRQAQSAQAEAMLALARATVTDDLTGLGNRRHGNALLDSLAPGDTLAMLDLDYFKRINDTFGHAAGDDVLQQFATFLLSAVRGWDSVARFGGEEFIIVLRGDGAGLEAIQRLLTGWRARSPLTTFSAGVAIHQPDQPHSSTLSKADAALYRAKAQGRNQAVVHTEPRPAGDGTEPEGLPVLQTLW
jgi:diguanylate cyclase